MKEKEHDEAVTYLRGLLYPGDTVYTTVTHVTSTGMTRWIRVLVMKDNQPVDISWHAGKALGLQVNTRSHDGVEVGGAGMDMGFHLVYSLSRVLFAGGWDCLQYHVAVHGDIVDLYHAPEYDRTRLCPSNDHSNRVDLHDLIVDGVVRHGDGGYALRHRWL